MVELYRFFLVALFFAVIYAACLKWVFQWGLFKLGVLREDPAHGLSRGRRVIRRGTLVIGGLGILGLAWAFIEPYFPRVAASRIQSKKITAPVRIVHLSDLHSDPVERAEDEVVEKVRSLKPDLILFTGDGVNSDEGIPLFRRTMRALAEAAPVYGVRGNWEVWWFDHVNTFRGGSIRELNGEAVPVEVSGQTIWIGGVAVDHEHLLKPMLRRMPKNAFRIVLHHFPAASRLVDGRADLLLSGDTHGGQLRLPLVGPLIRISRWDRQFHFSGLHRTRRGLLYYVNRGVGMEGSSVPRVRFNCPPEIALIELLPAR